MDGLIDFSQAINNGNGLNAVQIGVNYNYSLMLGKTYTSILGIRD